MKVATSSLIDGAKCCYLKFMGTIDIITPLFHKSMNMRMPLLITTKSFIILNHLFFKWLQKCGVNTSIIFKFIALLHLRN